MVQCVDVAKQGCACIRCCSYLAAETDTTACDAAILNTRYDIGLGDLRHDLQHAYFPCMQNVSLIHTAVNPRRTAGVIMHHIGNMLLRIITINTGTLLDYIFCLFWMRKQFIAKVQ